MTTEERLASLDRHVATLGQRLTDHTSQDEINFSRQSEQLNSIDDKLGKLLLREAHKEGEIKGMKRSAIALAGAISLIISIVGAVAAYVGSS